MRTRVQTLPGGLRTNSWDYTKRVWRQTNISASACTMSWREWSVAREMSCECVGIWQLFQLTTLDQWSMICAEFLPRNVQHDKCQSEYPGSLRWKCCCKKRCKSTFETAHSALLKLGGMPEDVGRFSKDCLPEATAWLLYFIRSKYRWEEHRGTLNAFRTFCFSIDSIGQGIGECIP